MHAALWMLGSLLVMVLLVGIFAAGSPQMLEDQVTVGTLSALGFLLVTAWLLVKYPGGVNLRLALGARPVDVGLVPLAAALGFCTQAPADALRRWVDEWVMKSGGAESGILLEANSPLESLALFMVLAALVPFAEEAFFRGAVFGALRRSRVSSGGAAFITGLGFTLAHANLQLFLPLAMVAAILSFLRAATGSLYPSLAAHAAFNAVPLASVAIPSWNLSSFGEAHLSELSFAIPLLLLGISTIANRSPWCRSAREAEAEPMFVERRAGE